MWLSLYYKIILMLSLWSILKKKQKRIVICKKLKIKTRNKWHVFFFKNMVLTLIFFIIDFFLIWVFDDVFFDNWGLSYFFFIYFFVVILITKTLLGFVFCVLFGKKIIQFYYLRMIKK
jgi:K+-sensing histidine kinase KdpD